MEGTLQLLEDCDTLDPIAPPTLISYFGTVFLICCPNPPNRNILFPLSDVIEEKAQSDYNPEEQVEGAFDYYDSEYVDYEYASQDPDSIDSTCHPLECMDRSLCDLKGLLSSTLLEANMTIIENGLCFQDLCHRSQRDRILTSLMAAHLPFGIPSDMMCATGFLDSPCHGDSGGPLYTRQEAIGENRGQTLVGLVSGGLSCGERTPSWFTRVSKYTRWVLCILTATKRFNHRAQILEDCQSLAPRIRRDPRQCSSTIQ
ncbi:hypothetical protein TCAL_14431 [Tigriopus californicus]|uniref:Peptidase S1 domain-containing protein n=1 Tax=Tigriopus californicus TaxID=6832 RepID=A0A553PLS3_TIGCA|nr:hypothetical protein TCAL_14431 [Tigriopus californicus]